MKDALCKAFCEALHISEVPIGLAVGTSFRQANGDAVGFYVSYEGSNRQRARLEDDGQTVATLEAAGINIANGPRANHLAELMYQAAVRYDAKECVFHTGYMSMDRLPKAALAFVGFLIRLQELQAWTKEAVEDTFKDDVIRAVQGHYAGRAAVLLGDEARGAVKSSKPDAVVMPPDVPPLALFIGTTEPKALEATVLHSDILAGYAQRAKVMLVIETVKPKGIANDTLTRAQNRFPVTVFPGQAKDVLARMDRELWGDRQEAVH